jgi:hypothetical protein
VKIRIAVATSLLLAACNQPRQDTQNTTEAPPPAATPTPAPTPAVDLSRFEGKYPFDKVDGADFLHQPPVLAAIERSGAPADVRSFILAASGPQSPIERHGLSLVAWGCEAHNCGAHNWAVQVGSDGTGGEVCYLDEDSGQPPRWYADGKLQAKQESCN